jgi:hypothetical protein
LQWQKSLIHIKLKPHAASSSQAVSHEFHRGLNPSRRHSSSSIHSAAVIVSHLRMNVHARVWGGGGRGEGGRDRRREGEGDLESTRSLRPSGSRSVNRLVPPVSLSFRLRCAPTHYKHESSPRSNSCPSPKDSRGTSCVPSFAETAVAQHLSIERSLYASKVTRG